MMLNGNSTLRFHQLCLAGRPYRLRFPYQEVHHGILGMSALMTQDYLGVTDR